VLKQSGPVRKFGIPVVTRLVFASACFGFAFWGKGFCRDFVVSVAAPDAYPGLNDVAVVLSWGLFFGPFALLGSYALLRACIRVYQGMVARRAPDAVEILPPLPGTAAAGGFRTHSPGREPLDDATRRRLDHLSARAARVSGIVLGVFFVVLGLTGFLLAWTQSYRPNGGFIPFGLALRFLVACGVSVLAGAFILRETFAESKTGWLVPLRVFTAIVGRRLSENLRYRRR